MCPWESKFKNFVIVTLSYQYIISERFTTKQHSLCFVLYVKTVTENNVSHFQCQESPLKIDYKASVPYSCIIIFALYF